MTSPDSQRTPDTVRRHPGTVRITYANGKRLTLGSAAFRLSQLYGESARTWEARLSGETSCYRRVAQINGLLRVMGMLDELTELMMPVELSLGPDGVLGLDEALHKAECADADEQLADEGFRYALRQETATIADAKDYLRKSALQCARAEVARREVHRWIEREMAKVAQ